MRIPTEWKAAIDDGRLLILSPFAEEQNRPTRQTAELRNEMIAHLASQVFIAYAEPAGKTEVFARTLLACERKVLTFDTELNKNLLDAGSELIQI
jgi:predicted Rossmann fold nucleotide-binding protein DprA/Smf involved in DNA uptake